MSNMKEQNTPPGFQTLKAWSQARLIRYSRAYQMVCDGKLKREDWVKISTGYFVRIGAKPMFEAPRKAIPEGFITITEWQARNNVDYRTTKKLIASGSLKTSNHRGFVYLEETSKPDPVTASALMR